MGLRDKMGVRSRRESGKHFGYFPWGGAFLVGESFTCAGPGNPEDWIRNAEKAPQKIILDQIREG